MSDTLSIENDLVGESNKSKELAEKIKGRDSALVEATTTASTANQITAVLKDSWRVGLEANKLNASNWFKAVPGTGIVETLMGNNPILGKVVEIAAKKVGVDIKPPETQETSLVESAASMIIPGLSMVNAQKETFRIAFETTQRHLANVVEIGGIIVNSPEAGQTKEALSNAVTSTVEATKARIDGMKGLASTAAAKLFRRS